MALPQAPGKRAPGVYPAQGTLEGESLSDEDESLSPSAQDSPHAKGGKKNPLRMWAQSVLGG